MLGFTPEQVDRMSLWELAACVDGYARANGAETKPRGKPMSIERMRELGLDGV